MIGFDMLYLFAEKSLYDIFLSTFYIILCFLNFPIYFARLLCYSAFIRSKLMEFLSIA